MFGKKEVGKRTASWGPSEPFAIILGIFSNQKGWSMSRKGVECLGKDKGRKWGPGLHEGLEKAGLGTFSRPCPVFPKTFDIKKAPQMNWKSPQKEKGFEKEPQRN